MGHFSSNQPLNNYGLQPPAGPQYPPFYPTTHMPTTSVQQMNEQADQHMYDVYSREFIPREFTHTEHH